MGYLIDTHVCIWLISDKNMLSEKVTTIIEDESQRIFISPISFFEIAIKLKIGKLPNFNTTLPQFIKSVYETGIESLPFKVEHLTEYLDFNFSTDHRDPFDRYLAAVALFEKMPIITKDDKFKAYTPYIQVIW